MKIVFALLLMVSPLTDLNEVARINEHKKAANEAYLNEDFELAAHHYQFLVDSLQVREEAVLLNLANALFKLQDTTSARNYYNSVVSEGLAKKSKSVAHQQLGLMDYEGKKYKEALGQFKKALKNDPTNEAARYNYELLKKIVEEQEENQEQDQNKDQQDQNKENQEQKEQDKENQEQNQDQQQNQEQNQEQQDQENQEQQDQEQQENQDQQQEQKEGEEQKPEEGEESEENPENKDPTTAEKLKEMNISEEKAEMILEALKNNEVQYIQQNKRKAKQKKKSGKPDW